jgi:CO dehydrogenase maturation factor
VSYLIAVSGKGGVGKTTIAALLISRLIARKKTPVLAVDADPNTCLDEMLGVRAEKTVGGVREEARKIAGKGMEAGVSKQELLELKIAECLVEADHFDLIAMGRSEGPGCYCYANNVLKETLKEIARNYPCVVLDNEAGMENLSRRIVQKVDLLIMVTDPSKRGLETVKRLLGVASEMEITYNKLVVCINRNKKSSLPATVKDLQETTGADLIIGLPEDETLGEFSEEGKSIFALEETNPVVGILDRLLDSVGF